MRHNNMNKINEKIKELYGSKLKFCIVNKYKYKNFASKLRTVQNYIDWLNKFLEALDLKIEIVPLQEK